MTRHKSFKRLVRARMASTGESYTAARHALLGAETPPAQAAATPPLATSDENIRRRTGRGWEEWFDLLDDWGAADRPHREIARRLAEEQGAEPLARNVQAVVGSYERARGLRAVGEHADGFAITASKTVGVPVESLYDAFVVEGRRARWLPDARLRERTATRPKSARFDWDDGETRVHVAFAAKGETRSVVTVEHARLAGAEEAEAMKAWWRGRLAALKPVLEGGEPESRGAA